MHFADFLAVQNENEAIFFFAQYHLSCSFFGFLGFISGDTYQCIRLMGYQTYLLAYLRFSKQSHKYFDVKILGFVQNCS